MFAWQPHPISAHTIQGPVGCPIDGPHGVGLHAVPAPFRHTRHTLRGLMGSFTETGTHNAALATASVASFAKGCFGFRPPQTKKTTATQNETEPTTVRTRIPKRSTKHRPR
eukprot:5618835-Pyramimonas_sp.AAC.1